MAKLLVTADLHFTTSVRDSYRFGILPWLAEQARKHDVEAILLLGDITDKKDHHPAELVNKIVTGLLEILDKTSTRIVIIRGNHDYIDKNHTYFEFLSTYDGITLATKRQYLQLSDSWAYLIPHDHEWKIPKREDVDREGLQYVFLHQTFGGAVASNGAVMPGLAPVVLPRIPNVLYVSGDIHVPQRCGHLHYVGSPYAIHFGDNYTPRVLLLSGTSMQDLHYPAPKKTVVKINDPEELPTACSGLSNGDMVKVRVRLPKASFVDWVAYKQKVVAYCADVGLIVMGIELHERTIKKRVKIGEQAADNFLITPASAFREYCIKTNLSKSVSAVGKSILEETINKCE